ncbi:nectin-3 isoform X4 [Podarcis muralis]
MVRPVPSVGGGGGGGAAGATPPRAATHGPGAAKGRRRRRRLRCRAVAAAVAAAAAENGAPSMAGSIVAADAPPAPPGRRRRSSSSPPSRLCCRRRRPAAPALPGLLSLGLLLSRVCCVEPVVSLKKGPNALIDGANQTLAAICTAATGKPAAEVLWEGSLGEMESTSTSYPNETVTVESKYKLVPTRFARGRHITCVVKHPALEKEIRMVYVLDIQYSPEVTVTGYDGNWYIGRENVLLRCNADANPLPMEFTWSRLDRHWPEGLQPLNNTLHFNSPLTYNYTGTYVCTVANPLGQKSDQKTIYILDPPTTTTSPPTIPWLPSTDGITGLATQPKLKLFPTSPWPAMQEDNWGTIIGSAVGGALFLIFVCVLAGVILYRRRRTFRGDYFAKNYIPPSDMQKESQIDTLQVEDVDSYPDSVKKEIKHPVNSHITKDYLGESEKTDWNKVDTINRYQDRYERPMDYYEGGTLGMKYLGEECYEENEDDLVSHVDGSVISRKEWYV